MPLGPTAPTPFLDKPVFDWNQVPIGKIVDLRAANEPGAPPQLVIALAPQAKRHLKTHEDLMEIPLRLVFGIRTDGVSLDRSLNELARNGQRIAALATADEFEKTKLTA